ncbi:N-acetylmuramoyl-L-alanine amidase [Mesorhizobium sp. CAU 1741]|uniref:N-acetylmuramoyl-L-alanine amidase n=1 Tax=Mesorhizobium sp. CAU 1741 TaxID=3140366 RepID=UPI00325B3F42
MSGFAAEHRGAEVRLSPNFGPRRNAMTPDCLILHYTGMETGLAAENWLCAPESEVSSHYLVHEDGRIVQMVRESDRAWHAGKGSWKDVPDVNSFSIGIEIVNCGPIAGFPPFPDVQIEAVVALSRDICDRWSIAPERVLAHSDVAPGRKIDPGERFPWAVLAANGVGHFVEPAAVRGGRFLAMGERGQPVEALQSMLSLYGYGLEINGFFDQTTRDVVEAFQRHFRPALVDGVADQSTIETLHRLLSALVSADS